jgi:hypothetical protein
MGEIPTIIIAECVKRQKMEQTAAEATTVQDQPASATMPLQPISPNFGPPPPVAQPLSGPTTSALPDDRFEVVIRFPAITVVEGQDIKNWLFEKRYLYEIVSQNPIKGV